MIRVPFFLLVGFNKGTPPKKGKRVLLGNLVRMSDFRGVGLGFRLGFRGYVRIQGLGFYKV